MQYDPEETNSLDIFHTNKLNIYNVKKKRYKQRKDIKLNFYMYYTSIVLF